jgi:signal transduction histidine kinase
LTVLALVVTWLDDRIRKNILNEVARSSIWFVEDYVRAVVQELATSSTLSDQAKNKLAEFAATSTLGRRLVDIKIWGIDRRILFSTRALEISTSPPSTPELESALAGQISSQLDDRNDFKSSSQWHNGGRTLKVYFPLHALDSHRTIAVGELYLDGAELVDNLWSARWESGLIVGLINALFLSIVVGIAWHGRNITTLQRREINQKLQTQKTLARQNNLFSRRILHAKHHNELHAKDHNELTDQILMHVGSDLHDGPAQLLSVALLRLGEISSADTSASSLTKRDMERIDAARLMIQDALSEIRQIAKGLILPQLEDLHTADIVRMAIANHKRRTLTDVKLEIEIDGRDFPVAIKRCLFRCIQEGLNNAFRHAGGREQFVRVLAEDERVVLMIKDAGPGLDRSRDRPRNALGIAGLRNRVEILGGCFSIKSSAGEGTEIIVALPLVGRHE